jgi:hypothetical protein
MLGILLLIVGVQFIFFGLLAEMIAYASKREEDYSITRIVEGSGSDVKGHVPEQPGVGADLSS